MTTKTISDLIEKTTVSDNDVMLIEGKDATNKVTKANFLKEVSSQIKEIKNNIPYDNIKNYDIIGDGSEIPQNILYDFFDNLSNKENISLFIPPGKYNMENMVFKNIENTKNITIYGYGAEFYWETCNTAKQMFSFKKCDTINIFGVKFKGAGMDTVINANEDIVSFHLCKNIRVRDCIFTDIGNVALRFGYGTNANQDNPVENIILENSYFENVFQISTTPSGSINYKCLNNTFKNLGGGVKFAQRYGKGHDVIVDGNYILADNQSSIQSGIEIYGYDNITIKNNVIKAKNKCILIYGNDEANYLTSFKNVIIENNDLYAIDKNGIFLRSDTDVPVDNVRISNNKIKMMHTSRNFYPITFQGKEFNNIFIVNNEFEDVCGYAIELNFITSSGNKNNFVIEGNKTSNVTNFIVIRKNINELKIINNNMKLNSIFIGLIADVTDLYLCNNILEFNYSDFTNRNIENVYMKNNTFECNAVFDGGNITDVYSQNNIFIKPSGTGAIIKQYSGNYHGMDNFYNLSSPLANLSTAKMYDKSINYTTNGAPKTIPLFVGQTIIDNTNSKVYIAKDTTSVSDWLLIN